MSAPFSTDDLGVLATGIALLDRDLRVLWLNDALAETLEVGVRSLRGQDFSALVAEPRFAEQVARVLAGQTQVRMRAVTLHTLHGGSLRADLDLQVRAPDTLLLEVHALSDNAGSDTPLSATLRGFAHEVKNPLAGLRGAAQLLQRRVDDAGLADLAGMVIAEADRLATLADRLLRHGGRPQLGPVDMHAVLGRVEAVLDGQTQAPRIVHDYDPSLPAGTGDTDRLQQLLLNLARNAVEAGARTLTFRTRVEHGLRLGDHVLRTALRVDVIDDGDGVPEALRDTLFQPLVSGRADGTGLGLALARETAHEHGGELRCSSRPGATVFSLYLPLGEAHA
ncbi:two-component system sensor histidine kinase NtrB [Oleiagrimonas soli]|uniref:histidine kinase n=3 Tax=Oleiagrimonas soli TaxID=1543381 RepID=A0A841KLY1_9GAMM|nr:ATP-binding protein [Oleiagrimonas soli]MBB6184829.1 two-component system nitrogen regulation sensor histidine kinase GlnL [Oleiagrimonas soli]